MPRPPEFGCQLCGSQTLSDVDGFGRLARVTSDCKPWPAGGRLVVCRRCGAIQKLPDARWLSEIARIYKAFEIYHQAGGAEQFVFDGKGDANPRSAKLAAYLAQKLPLKTKGRLLDLGCGNGTALASFSRQFPAWSMCGSEVDAKTLPALRKIRGFETLFTCPPRDIPGPFDLVTLIHSLEHLLDPVAALEELTNLLSADGVAFVEVVDCLENPYDILVADHLLHFTRHSLEFATHRAGFTSVLMSEAVVRKELTWIGRPDAAVLSEETPLPADAEAGPALAARHVDWLTRQSVFFQEVARRHPTIGVFGTAISATWLAPQIEDRLAFFVDEDPGRIGREHLGRPIVSPADVPDDAQVLVPLVPEIGQRVAERLARPGIVYHLPPPLTQGRARADRHSL